MISTVEMLISEGFGNISNSTWLQNVLLNFTNIGNITQIPERGSLHVVISMTVVYAVLLLTGVVGNMCTCIVIAKNRYMHTATNYYLFSLAISDILLLVMGLPQEIYLLWIPFPYVFGESFCVLRGFTAETSTNASILTITAFTVERFVAICHPLKAQTMSSLSRAIKTIVTVWISAAAGAVPMAYQFGIIYQDESMSEMSLCAIKRASSIAFTLSSVVFYLIPLIVISILYVKIGVRLRASACLLKEVEPTDNRRGSYQFNKSRRTIVKMLVAVVVSFFVCWSPFQAQRLMAIYMDEDHSNFTIAIFNILTDISGVTYYLSATINPILYQLMSLKFQQAFKDTFGTLSQCLRGEQDIADNNVTEHTRTTISTCRRKSQSISGTRRTSSVQNFFPLSDRSSLPCNYKSYSSKRMDPSKKSRGVVILEDMM